MSIQAQLAKATKEVTDGLGRALLAMPADKQGWKPLDEGRSAIDQIAECAVINAWCTQIFQTREVPPLDNDAFGKACSELDTAEKSLSALNAYTDTLVAAMESLPDDALTAQVQFPWDSTPSTIADALLVPYWNMTYHVGQICYIQTLYGDKQMH